MFDERDNIKLIDFGLCADLTDLSHKSALLDKSGTVGYMAPEILTNAPGCYDYRADMYSLGVILIECLIGRNPMLIVDYNTCLHNNMSGRIDCSPLPCSHRLKQVIEQMVNPDPHLRISIEEAVAGLRNCLHRSSETNFPIQHTTTRMERKTSTNCQQGLLKHSMSIPVHLANNVSFLGENKNHLNKLKEQLGQLNGMMIKKHEKLECVQKENDVVRRDQFFKKPFATPGNFLVARF